LADAAPLAFSGQDESRVISLDPGMISDAQISETAPGHYRLSANAAGLDASAGQVVFANSNYLVNDWRAYDSLSLAIKNTGSAVLRLNFAVRNSPLVSLTVDNGQPALWQGSVGQQPTSILPLNGMFEFSPGEAGILTIPFSSLSYAGKHFPIDFFITWNIMFFVLKNERIEAEFGGFTLNRAQAYKRGVAPGRAQNVLEGDDAVPRPIAGAESIAFYKPPAMAGAEFALAADYAGVTISPDGRLVVTDSARPGRVTIVAKDRIGNTAYKYVSIIGPNVWGNEFTLMPAQAVAGYDMSVWWLQESSYRAMRWALAGLFILMLGFYAYGRRLNARHNSLAGRG
jgi:hypothetical protein